MKCRNLQQQLWDQENTEGAHGPHDSPDTVVQCLQLRW